MNAKEIAAVLDEIAMLMELMGENTFKVRAHVNASRVIENYPGSIEDLIADIEAKQVKGLGEALSEKVLTLYREGELPYLDKLRSQVPEGLVQMTNIPGLGGKKVKTIHQELGITSIEELEKACQEGKLASLKGFGAKTEEKILKGIERLRAYSGQYLHYNIVPLAELILQQLRNSEHCISAEVAGSLRRRKEIVKDIDIIAASSSPANLMETFVSLEQVQEVTSQGHAKSSVILETGISADLRVVSEEQFPSALLHFTGSKEHNTELRSRAKTYGYSLNEYGLHKDKDSIILGSEKAVYAALELAYIAPELRESNGEVESAAVLFSGDDSPENLIETKDIKGVLHAHSTYSDGACTIGELALAVKERGYQYLGLSDHSQSAAYAGGLLPDDIKRQHEEIDRLNEKLAPFRIFKGIESDILSNGSLDYSDDVLETFDFIIASIHSSLTLSREKMTERIITAIRNPYTTILGHVSGRLLLKRDAYQVDIPKVLEAAAEHGVALELNANPRRLDLDWRHHQYARELGVPIPICPDAHSIKGIDHIESGIGAARKGGLSVSHVPSAWDLADIEQYFKTRETPNE